MNAVATFAVASDFGDIAIEFRPTTVSRVEPEQITIFDDRAIFQVIGGLSDGGREPRLMQLERCVLQPINQEAINKQLTRGSYIANDVPFQIRFLCLNDRSEKLKEQDKLADRPYAGHFMFSY